MKNLVVLLALILTPILTFAQIVTSGGSPRGTAGGALIGRYPNPTLRDFVSAKDYGATCDGSTDDTSGVQAALTALGVNGGILLLDNCKVNAASLTFPALTRWLVLNIKNRLTLTSTLTVPRYVSINGLGGGTATQFQHREAVNIIAPPGNVPTLIITPNTIGARVANVTIANPIGPEAILIGGTAGTSMVELDNVGVTVFGGQTTIPLVVDNAFWVWINHCVFNASLASSASIRLTTTPVGSPGTGLVYINDTIIAGQGILIDAQTPVNTQGNIFIDGLTYESGNTSLLRVDLTNGGLRNLKLSNVGIADAVGVPYVIERLDTTGNTIADVEITGSGAGLAGATYSNVSIPGLYAVGASGTNYNLGLQRHYSTVFDGILDSEWVGQGMNMAPSLAPTSSLATQQDVTLWSGLTGSAAVTTGVQAPDGSTTAATLSSASGLVSRRVLSTASSTPSVGDWYIAGVWIKATTSTGATGQPIIFGFTTTGDHLDSGGTNGNTITVTNSTMKDLSSLKWTALVTAAKVTVVSGATSTVMDLIVEPGKPTAFWMPWALRIPAGTMDDGDVIRFTRYLRNMPASMPSGGGILSLFAHQKLYWGSDTNIYRSAAGALKTDGTLAAESFLTVTNCASSASPAVCSSASAGTAAIATSATTVVVNTTAVTANSEIMVTEDQSLGTRLSVTCNTQSSLVVGTPHVTARTAGTSFTVGVDVAPTANPICFSYQIVN